MENELEMFYSMWNQCTQFSTLTYYNLFYYVVVVSLSLSLLIFFLLVSLMYTPTRNECHAYTIGHQFQSQLFSFSLQLFCSVFVYFPFCNHWLFIWVTFQCVFHFSHSCSLCVCVCILYVFFFSLFVIIFFFRFFSLFFKIYIVYCYRICLAIFKPLRWRFSVEFGCCCRFVRAKKKNVVQFRLYRFVHCKLKTLTHKCFRLCIVDLLGADAVSWMNSRALVCIFLLFFTSIVCLRPRSCPRRM